MEQMTSVSREQVSLETSLEGTVRDFNEAFNRLDAKQLASFWADEGTLLNPFGNYGKGRSGVERVLHEDAERFLAGTKITAAIVGARKIEDDCVFLDLEQQVENYPTERGSRGPMKMHAAIVAKKKGERWQWLDARVYFFRERPEPLH